MQRSIGAHSHSDGRYGINTYLALSLHHAKAFNETNCWVCTRIPHSAVRGIPLLAMPFDLSECCGYWNKLKEWDGQDDKDWGTGWFDQIVTVKNGKCIWQRNFSG